MHINDIFNVKLAKQAQKDLKKTPFHVAYKLQAWIESIEHSGLNKIRQIPGYHDEPLKGIRYGQRSIRLNKSYRAIYIIINNSIIEFVEVQEVNKHDY